MSATGIDEGRGLDSCDKAVFYNLWLPFKASDPANLEEGSSTPLYCRPLLSANART